MEDILVIGIAGGSGSGKTTLMKNIMAQFGDVITVVSHDNYYKRLDHLTYEERCAVNYDEPAKVWEVTYSTANTLGNCQSVYMDENGVTLLIVYGE